MKNQIKTKDDRKHIIYARKSKFTGKGESINNQIEACKKRLLLAYEDIDIDKDVLIFKDEGFTGYNVNRPDLQNVIKLVKENKVRSVTFYKLDRISRNVSDFSDLVQLFDNYDVCFLSATESIENVTPTGRAMMFIISVFAQLERDTIAERIRDNMLELAKTGRWLGGCTPTGFESEKVETISVDGKKRKLYKLSPIDDEISIIKLLFEKMKILKSQTKLETYTIQNDIKTKNNKDYTRWSLKNILTNPVYATADEYTFKYFNDLGVDIYGDIEDFDGTHGLMVYNKTEKKRNQVIKKDYEDWILAIGKHKGIISGKDWVEVQNLLDEKSCMRYRKPSASNCLLSGILRCSHCGSFMRAKLKNQSVDENGRRKFDYMCELKEKSRKQKCQCKNINGLEADELVINEIKKIAYPNSKFLKELNEISNDTTSLEYQNNEELKNLKNQINKNEKEISILLERIKYIDLELLDDLSKEIKDLKRKNESLQNQIIEKSNHNYDEISDKESADFLITLLNQYYNDFYDLDLIGKRNLIKLLTSSITSDGENLYINFIGARTLSNDIIPTGDSCKRNTNVFQK